MRRLVCVFCLFVLVSNGFASAKKAVSLSLTDRAIAASYAGFQTCKTLHMKCAIVVVDNYGVAISSMQMTGVMPLYAAMANAEAFTSGTMGASTDALRAFSQKHKPLNGIQGSGYWGRKILLSSGGYALFNKKTLIGGVGVNANRQGNSYSAWSAKNDQVAKAVVDAFAKLHDATIMPKSVVRYLTLKTPGKSSIEQIFSAALYHGKAYCIAHQLACALAISNVHGDDFILLNMVGDYVKAQVPFAKITALTAAATGVASGKLQDRSPLDNLSSGIFGHPYGRGYLTGVAGGYPILYQGIVIGGVGIGTADLSNPRFDYRSYDQEVGKVIIQYIKHALKREKATPDVMW